MRDTVSRILQVEANRLHAISISEGLTDSNLLFLNKLIDTYEKFVGATDGEEAEPELQDTAALLASVIPKPEPRPTPPDPTPAEPEPLISTPPSSIVPEEWQLDPDDDFDLPTRAELSQGVTVIGADDKEEN